MNRTSIAALVITASCTSSVAFADPPNPDRSDTKSDAPTKLTLFTSAGYLATSGGNGGALGTGIRYAIGEHFALGFDLGYGLMALQTGMQDRWWFMPNMAVVIPTRIANMPLSIDIGAGLGLGTSSGYASWSEYTSHPFTADWEFQLEPAVRAHAIAALGVSRSLEVFVRADAAALVLPHGSASSSSDSTWLMFAIGTRFRLL